MGPIVFDRMMIEIEIGSNLKIGRLSDREFRCLVCGVWPVAAKANPRGYLAVVGEPATAQDIAHQAHVPVAVARKTLVRLRELKMLELHADVGLEYCHDWHLINPDPKSDATAADRQRRKRERDRNGSVTRDSHAEVTAVVTPRAVTVTPPEVEGEVEGQGSKGSSSSSGAERADEKATDEDRRLCRLLAELAKERNPKFKVKSKARWLTDMRLLRERDGNTETEIEETLRWVFQHHFWSGVIESPGSLREHFPKIWGQRTGGGQVVPINRKENASDWLRAMDGGAA